MQGFLCGACNAKFLCIAYLMQDFCVGEYKLDCVYGAFLLLGISKCVEFFLFQEYVY